MKVPRTLPTKTIKKGERFGLGCGGLVLSSVIVSHLKIKPPNGWRYPRVGGMRQRHFDGTNCKPRKLFENAATPTRRVHALLAGFLWLQLKLSVVHCVNLSNFFVGFITHNIMQNTLKNDFWLACGWIGSN